MLDLNCLNCLNIFVVIKRKEATLQSNQNKKVPHSKLSEPDPPNEQAPSPSPGGCSRPARVFLMGLRIRAATALREGRLRHTLAACNHKYKDKYTQKQHYPARVLRSLAAHGSLVGQYFYHERGVSLVPRYEGAKRFAPSPKQLDFWAKNV